MQGIFSQYHLETGYGKSIRHPDNPLRSPQVYRASGTSGTYFALLKNWQSISIHGSQRIGKTSLLACLKNEYIQRQFHFPSENFLFISIELSQVMSGTLNDFFHNLNYTIRQQGRKYLVDIYKEEKEDNEFIHLLDVLNQQGIHPTLMIDTFDAIKQYQEASWAFFGFLRALGNTLVTYIITSIQNIAELCPPDEKDLGSPFFNIFASIRLGPFSANEAQEMLITLSRAENLPFTAEEVDWLLEKAGRHPYFLRTVGAVLFEEKQRNLPGSINWEQVSKEAYQSLKAHFKHFWFILSDEKKKSSRARNVSIPWIP